MVKDKKPTKEKKVALYQYDKELASAFKVDCEEFLEEFEKLQSFRFSDFAKVWQQKDFTYVFAGQNLALLLQEFCENCFYNVKKYIMFPRTIYTQIGAFYLLYGLYYKQPLKGWIKVRLTLEEYQKIFELIQEMKNRRELDSVYIFAKMKVEGAFLYVASRTPLGPEDRFVKRFQIYINDTFTSVKSQSSVLKFHEICNSSELIKKAQDTNNEYQKLLKKYSEKCPIIAPFQSTVFTDLQNAYRKYQDDRPLAEGEEDEEQEEVSVVAKRRSIRDRAMANKNAVYRSCKKVKTAFDVNTKSKIEETNDSDSSFSE